MKKGTVIGLLIFIILSGGLFVLFTNLEIAVFPGTQHSYDFFERKPIEEETTVSLAKVIYPEVGDDNTANTKDDVYSTLSIVGYAMAVGILFFIPLLLTWPFARRHNRRAARRKAQQTPGQNVV
jgi:hypothetical protein